MKRLLLLFLLCFGLALPSLAASGISFNPTQVRQKRGRFDPRWNSDYLAFQLMAFW